MASQDGGQHSPKRIMGKELLNLMNNNNSKMTDVFKPIFADLTTKTHSDQIFADKLYSTKLLSYGDHFEITHSNDNKHAKLRKIYLEVGNHNNWKALIYALEPDNENVIEMILQHVKHTRQRVENVCNQYSQIEETRISNTIQEGSHAPRDQPSNRDEEQQPILASSGVHQSTEVNEQRCWTSLWKWALPLSIVVLTVVLLVQGAWYPNPVKYVAANSTVNELETNVLKEEKSLEMSTSGVTNAYTMEVPLTQKPAVSQNTDNLRSITFGSSETPKEAYASIEKFKYSINNITFFFTNNLCDEFSNYNASTNMSKVEVKCLNEIHFSGDIYCTPVFQFVVNHISLQNVRVLRFTETNINYSIVSLVQQLFQTSQSTLESIYLKGVLLCTNCSLFSGLDFSNLINAELNFKLGTGHPVNANTINIFNSNIHKDCLSTIHNNDTLQVKC